MPLTEILRAELAELHAYVPHVPDGIRTRLDANEAPAPPRVVRAAIEKAIAHVALERYPDARALELKDAIASRTGAPSRSIVVGTGSDELIALVATACARARGRVPAATFLAPTPTFVMYHVTSRAHGVRAVSIPLDANWDLDLSAMNKAIELLQPNVIFIASPNNPTGNRMSADRIEAIAAAASDALVVVDEAYVDFSSQGSARALRDRFENVAILRTLSKLGLAALRVGWIEADASIVAALDRARQPFNVSATSQAAATAVMREAWEPLCDHVHAIVRERERVAEAMRALPGITPLPSEANFVWAKTEKPAARVHEHLISRGVLVRSFHSVGGRMAQHIRVTIGTREENDAMLAALTSAAEVA